jgi:hypothetical protein
MDTTSMPTINYNALNKSYIAQAKQQAMMAKYTQALARGQMVVSRISASPLDPRVVGTRSAFANQESSEQAYQRAKAAARAAMSAYKFTRRAY